MKHSFYILWSLLILTMRRLWSRPGLSLLALLGITLAVGLLSSTAFFTQAVDRVILNQELAELSRVTGRIPFSTRVYFLPSSRSPVGLVDAEAVGRSIASSLSTEIGLPVGHFGVTVESSGMMLLPREGDTKYGDGNSFLGMLGLAYVSEIANRIEIVAGEPFTEEGSSDGDILDVWMHSSLAAEMGINVGESFDIALNISQPRRPLIIRGLWQAIDPTERFWFNNPDANLKDVLLIRRQDYITFIQPMTAAKSGVVAWHIILDDRRMNPALARQYAEGFELGMQVINQYLPGARLDVSALDPLKEFVQRQTTLTTILLGFNVPALGFLLAFLILVSVIIAEWQRRETAIMVSRGMSTSIILGLTILEEILLFIIGIPLGIGFGMMLARLMGNTVSFLSFTSRAEFPVSLQGASVQLIGLALCISLLSRLIPTLLASRQSVVAQAQERARPVRAPFWQRAYLDLLLILPTVYVYDQLAQRGSLATLVDEEPGELFQDPLLVLLPTLFVVTSGLLSMRIFPLLMRVLDVVASRMPWLTIHLALRQLGRYTQGYINPLLLVVISLALGIYAYSLAASLDQWLVDRIYYQVGADVSFEPHQPGSDQPAVGTANDPSAYSAGWIPPEDEFTELPAVVRASRMGRFRAEIPAQNDRKVRGHFIAIDRVDFPHVAWFRSDFAPESLGAMMNRLAIAPENILVHEEYLRQTGRRIGDKIRIEMRLEEGIRIRSEFTIAGLYTYFPTVDEDAVAVIGNLDHIFFLGGAPLLHNILLKTSKDEARNPENTATTPEQSQAIFGQVESLGVAPTRKQHAGELIAEEQARFERVGIFGTLSVGFMAAATMAVLALLVYSNASLQERLYQFGVMRAVGLMRNQVIGQVILEYAIIILYGAIIGLWIGGATSALFVPFFRIADAQSAPLPPLIPVVAQDEIVPLTVVFVACMVFVETSLIVRAMRGRLFDALRMGHQG